MKINFLDIIMISNYKFVLNQNLYSGGETENTIKSLEKKLDVAKNQYQITLQTR